MIGLYAPSGDPQARVLKRLLGRMGQRVVSVPAENSSGFRIDARIPSHGPSRGNWGSPKGYPLERLKVIWWQPPGGGLDSPGTQPTVRTWMQFQRTRLLFDVLRTIPHALWVNSVEAVTGVASNKLGQLIEAKRGGFIVPETIAASSKTAVRQFSGHGPVVSKPLGPPFFVKAGQLRRAFTEIVNTDTLPTRFPTFWLQQQIPRRRDIRVHLIGTTTIGVSIEFTTRIPPRTPADWRAHLKHVKVMPCAVPAEIREKCSRLSRRLGLIYNAMDFIETPAGEWVFLESNPFPNLLWYQRRAHLPLTEILADLLIALAKKNQTVR